MSSHKTYTLPLHLTRPPLNMNDRMHWAKRSKIKRELRQRANIAARVAGLPRDCSAVIVQLVYRPRDRRRRDPSNFMPTQKPVLDGLVDYGLVPDDCPPYVTELIPRVAEVEKGAPGSVWVEVTVVDPTPVH